MKIEVLKELPWAVKGEMCYLNENGGWVFNINGIEVCIGYKIIREFDKLGWIKFIDEKKTLKEKLKEFVDPHDVDEIIEICRQHSLEALPKEADPSKDFAFTTISYNDAICKCRKAIREVK